LAEDTFQYSNFFLKLATSMSAKTLEVFEVLMALITKMAVFWVVLP
jgi:hypothetical protein